LIKTTDNKESHSYHFFSIKNRTNNNYTLKHV